MHEEESFGIIPLALQDDGWHILLVKISSGFHWGFPKGHAEPHETPLEAACRELTEETALAILELFPLDPLFESYQIERSKGKVRKSVTYFPALVTGTLSLQKGEVLEASWVPIEKVAEQITYATLATAWKKYLISLKKYLGQNN